MKTKIALGLATVILSVGSLGLFFNFNFSHLAASIIAIAVNEDQDNDGVFDEDDNCILVENADQADTDADGTGNACDCDSGDALCTAESFCEYSDTPDQDCLFDDADSDGVPDENDNCVYTPNDDQIDADQDSFGAACDCNDSEPLAYPDALEVCDGIDNNCNNQIDENKSLRITFSRTYKISEHVYVGSGVYEADANHIASFPLDGEFITAPTEQPGIIIHSGDGYFDVGLYGKNDGKIKEAVEATIELKGMTIYHIKSHQGVDSYEGIFNNQIHFKNPGKDEVDILSPHKIQFTATVSGHNDVFRVFYHKTTCNESSDSDNDGVVNTIDRCPASMDDDVFHSTLGNYRLADVDGDGVFETKEKKLIKNSNYSLSDTYGCTCSDILETLEYQKYYDKHGCTERLLKSWIETSKTPHSFFKG